MSCKTNYVAVFLFLVLLSGGWSVWASQGSEEERPVSVSVIIANPEKFDGRRLRVIGILGYGGGLDRSVCLYVSEPDASKAVMPNCIYVDQSVVKNDKRLGKYVILNATFHYASGNGLKYLSFKHVSDLKLWSFPPDK